MLLINLAFGFLAFAMIVYLVRHYVFTAITLIYGRDAVTCFNGGETFEPFVSIVVPAHNEEKVIGRLLERICQFSYPREKLEVIVVDDGSKDKTGEIVDAFSREYGFIKSLHRSSACGKAAALNEALKHVHGEIVYFFDADYFPDVNFVEFANRAFYDLKVGAVQGCIRVLNLGKWVSNVVSLERIGGYRVDQLAREILGLVPQFGGTAGGVRRSLLEDLGGFDECLLAEDTDLTFRVYLAGFKIRYLFSVVSFEEAVEGWRGYWRQRKRWAKGHMQCFFKHFLPLIKSRNLTFREKLDGLLLLCIYFVPILVGVGWLLGCLSFLLGYGLGAGRTALILTLIYFVSGNLAPLSEIIVGVILEKQLGLLRYLPLLFVAFILNVFICTKAFVEILVWRLRGEACLKWDKTVHKG